MYDLDSDGKISRDELLSVLHMMVGANISDEQVQITQPLSLSLQCNSCCCFQLYKLTTYGIV